jgi:sec-independent protein translocase protein TatA
MTQSITGICLAWMPGPFEMGVILLVALLIFGSRLPSVMRNMGKSVTEFKKGVRSSEEDLKTAIDPPETPPTKHSNPALSDSEGNERYPEE